jgi:hypothetical protein
VLLYKIPVVKAVFHVSLEQVLALVCVNVQGVKRQSHFHCQTRQRGAEMKKLTVEPVEEGVEIAVAVGRAEETVVAAPCSAFQVRASGELNDLKNSSLE